ncbi:HP0495 family protein [Methylophaga nitratireducenticrescens]|uniref:UPF0250 protein Q7A_2827 n=1 Tax=Methylophaga nitratireducenticrescens TaxID=754476 RepID=I1XMJ0_METNJ|nr:DUF493 domain-containing protein [Methylophaga nitratireducenticrescens]AFI85609.1 DUF493 domain-containing protein [Methylophaga nitratireducenticrescens]AUZ85342.1 DUF493 domain-containing protein [Methylophaga nitratireducenticrescens]
MSESNGEETLLEFPCEYPVKAMGETHPQLDNIVVEIIRKHAGAISEGAVTSKQSSGGKYTSITVVIEATSKKQLDAIYQELSGHQAVKYVL